MSRRKKPVGSGSPSISDGEFVVTTLVPTDSTDKEIVPRIHEVNGARGQRRPEALRKERPKQSHRVTFTTAMDAIHWLF
jgi:hypothetical protein